MQKTTLKNKGLYTDPNQLSGLPDGSLVVGSNINIDRNDVIGSRRGFAQYGNTFGSQDDRLKQLLVYKNRILGHYGSTLLFNSVEHNNILDGAFEPFSGSFSELEEGLRIRSVESNKNLYFTTSDGIKKIAAKTADDFTTASGFIKDAGAVKALDVNGTLNSTTDGFLLANSEAAYRVVWSYKDINNNLIVGTPSSRLVISNATTNSANVNLDFVIPQNIDPSYFYQVYRSAVFTATGSLTLDDIDPGDELQLVIEDFPTPAQITANKITVTDLAPEDFRQGGDFLYTNPSSGDGIGQANDPPPKAKDVTMYQNTVFYANTETRANTTLSLLGVEALISGVSSITISDGTHTPQTYIFVGSKEQTKFDFTSYVGTVPADLNGKYFLFNSSSDKRKYYTWYDTTKTKQIIDFSLYIGVIPTDIDTKFFTIYTPDPDTSYYVWYDATGTSVDPGTDPTNNLTGFAGIRVNIVGLTTNAAIVAETATSIGTNDINGDYDVNYSTDTGTGSSAEVGSPTVITATAHGLNTGDIIIVSNSTTVPNINGEYFATVIDANNFSIDATVTTTGTIDWAGNDQAIVLYSNAFDTSAITEQQNVLKGFSFTFDTPDSLDPALDPITNTDIVGRIPFKVSISRGVSTLADLADATAASILQQDSASDFVVTYNTGDTFLEVDNSNNGKTTAASDSAINPVGNGFAVTILSAGDGEDTALKHILLSDAATPSQQIDETARSIVNVINNNSSDTVAAYYLSGPADLPGQFLLQVKDIGDNQFTVTADNADTGASFNPPLPPATGASTVSGEAEIKPNRIYFAKLQQPEAVPLLNFIDVGPADKAISRILALRESLFILKEDGVYRLTGTNGAYAVDLFDESTKIIAPDSAVVLNNQIYCLTNQGIVTISDTGVSIISRPIDTTIKLLTSSNYNFKHTTFGVSYETDRAYTIWLPSSVTDTIATIAYRYNTVTETFTTYDLAKTCGLVNLSGDDKLYLGPDDANFFERERKLFDRTDFADRQFDLTIPSNSVDGTTLKLSSSVKVSIGDAAVQTQYLTLSEYNQLLKKLDLDPAIGQAEITTFDFTSYTGSIPNALHSKYFTLFAASDSDRYVVFYDAHGDLPALDPNTFIDTIGAIQIRVDVSGAVTLADITSATQTAIRSKTFDFIITYFNGDTSFITKTVRNGNTSDAVDSSVNGLHNGFAITVNQQGLGDYFSALQLFPGNNILTKLNQLATKLDTDPGIAQNDFVAAIGTYSGTGTTISVLATTVIHAVAHHIQDGRLVTISGSTTTPDIDGNYTVTKIDADNFSIPISTTGTGSLNWLAELVTFEEAQAAFNTIVNKLNNDTSVTYQNYLLSEDAKEFEVLIIDKAQNTTDVTMQFSVALLEGPITMYKSIVCDIQYAPETFGDTSMVKQVTESTVIFEDTNFSRATVAFRTDLSPGYESIDFTKSGKGDFGYFIWSQHNWGGGFSGVPLRTYIPRQKQRCRYIQLELLHNSARERFVLYGFSYTYRPISERGYRS